MRRIHIILLLCCYSLACAQDTPLTVSANAAQEMCAYILHHYPAATLQDVYKTCYQDFFGAEHLMRDTAAARQYLHSELVQCMEQDLTAMPLQEPTGFRHRFVRINLQSILSGEITEDELLKLFIEAAGQDNAHSADWETEWQQIETIAIGIHPAWQNEALQQELSRAAQQKAAVRHSDAFRKSYNPHYRIIRNNNH